MLTPPLRGVHTKDVLTVLLSVSTPQLDLNLSHFDAFEADFAKISSPAAAACLNAWLNILARVSTLR